jgi:hypothetical protein
MRIVDAASFALVVVALALSIWQLLAARRQTKKLAVVTASLSTRYLGSFPHYVPELTSLLQRVQRELLILSTLHSHGAFSDPDGWLSIKHAIEDALSTRRRVRVSCVFGNPEQRRNLLKDQFKEDFTDWLSWSQNPSVKTKLETFLHKLGVKVSVDALNPDRFVELDNEIAHREMATTYRGANVVEVNDRLPIWMWVADGKEAVLVIPKTSPAFDAQAFWTADGRLIGAMKNIHEEYQTRGLRQD